MSTLNFLQWVLLPAAALYELKWIILGFREARQTQLAAQNGLATFAEPHPRRAELSPKTKAGVFRGMAVLFAVAGATSYVRALQLGDAVGSSPLMVAMVLSMVIGTLLASIQRQWSILIGLTFMLIAAICSVSNLLSRL